MGRVHGGHSVSPGAFLRFYPFSEFLSLFYKGIRHLCYFCARYSPKRCESKKERKGKRINGGRGGKVEMA